MTIIQPNRRKNKFSYVIGAFIVLLGAGAVFTIMFYNSVVDLRLRLAEAEKEMNKFEMQNAELKNRFYHITASLNAEDAAKTAGLENDKNPLYLTVEPRPVASNL